MNQKSKGILSAALSAAIYGFTPILARTAFDGGANGITVTFLRGALSLPFLLAALRIKNIPLQIDKDWKAIVLAGVLGISMTTLLLYMSYSYISVGMATTLHFTYPVLVTVAGALFFKDRLTRPKLIALLLCSMGIVLFMEGGSASARGMILSLLSGVTYTLYILCIDKTGLGHIHYWLLTFWLNVCMTATSGLFGVATGQLQLALTPKAWVLCVLVALFTAFGALPLLQQGVRLAGASTAAILSTLEPITSVLLGVLVLGESISAAKLFGCGVIVASICLITMGEGGAALFYKATDKQRQTCVNKGKHDCQ